MAPARRTAPTSASERVNAPRRIYGSIPHLPGSRAAADRVLRAPEARRCLDPTAARPGVEVVVQEKLDGSCVGVRVVRAADGVGKSLVGLGREGRLVQVSPNEGRRMFAVWLTRFTATLVDRLEEDEVLVGEWLALVHGTRYALAHEPFVPFDLIAQGPHGRVRAPVDVLAARLEGTGLAMPAIVHRGPPLPIDAALEALGPHGRHGAIDPPEGLVYRVERAGRVDLVAKYVSPDKVDGARLPENTGEPPMYHWRP